MARRRSITFGGSDGDIKPNFGEGAWSYVMGCGHVVGDEGEVKGQTVGDFRDDIDGLDVHSGGRHDDLGRAEKVFKGALETLTDAVMTAPSQN